MSRGEPLSLQFSIGCQLENHALGWNHNGGLLNADGAWIEDDEGLTLLHRDPCSANLDSVRSGSLEKNNHARSEHE